MAHLVCDYHPVDHITIDTIGPPGKRVFFLQASEGAEVVSLILEKQQAQAMASGLLQLLDQLDTDDAEDEREVTAIRTTEMALLPVGKPEFRVGQIGIGFDQESDLVVIIAYELPIEEDQDQGVARFWVSRERARALAHHALEVVEAGRPSCPLCGQPIDPEGHSCARSNGHGKTPELSDLDAGPGADLL
jgi:uncharacterized repeat protein (TIGR03847 family)